MKHPGFEVAITPEEMPIFQNPKECVLHQVFAKFLFPVEPVKETIQRSFITFKEQAQPV
jgi:hypothetical protein